MPTRVDPTKRLCDRFSLPVLCACAVFCACSAVRWHGARRADGDGPGERGAEQSRAEQSSSGAAAGRRDTHGNRVAHGKKGEGVACAESAPVRAWVCISRAGASCRLAGSVVPAPEPFAGGEEEGAETDSRPRSRGVFALLNGACRVAAFLPVRSAGLPLRIRPLLCGLSPPRCSSPSSPRRARGTHGAQHGRTALAALL
jgi:hypothetical protein